MNSIATTGNPSITDMNAGTTTNLANRINDKLGARPVPAETWPLNIRFRSTRSSRSALLKRVPLGLPLVVAKKPCIS